MALFLVEAELATAERAEIQEAIQAIADAFAVSGGELVEAQVAAGESHAFLILQGDTCAGVVLDADSLPGVRNLSETVPVRIVGATVEAVQQRGSAAGYLVEWDIPAEITMEQYLDAKARKSPLYDSLDDVAFLRTYVREDTQKCLCFYDAESEAAVRRAREVVDTPISRIHQLEAVVPAG